MEVTHHDPRVPRIFVAGYFIDAQQFVRDERIRRRPQVFKPVICTRPDHVLGHRLRVRDRVKVLRGADPKVVTLLRQLEHLLDLQLGELGGLEARLADTRFWQFRLRRDLRRRIEKIEQEVH